MRNGVEARPNGSKIVKEKVTPKFSQYRVYLPDGTPSKGGPWDYLCNARFSADGGKFPRQHHN